MSRSAAAMVARAEAEGVQRLAYNPHEFAGAIGVSYDTAIRMCQSGQVGWFPAGASYRIPVSEVDRLISEALQRRTA